MLAEQQEQGELVADTSSSKHTKQKSSSFLNRLFGPKTKRARKDNGVQGQGSNVAGTMTNDTAKGKGDAATEKKTKPTLEKSRKKEVKERLNAEASREIRPLAIGTFAMMASALSNRGRLA